MLEIKFKIDMKDIEELVKKYPEISKNVRAEKLTEAGEFLQREIQLRTPEGVGDPVHLRSAIGFMSGVVYGGKISIGTKINYAECVEYDTKPHWIPTSKLKPLLAWVNRKLGYNGKELRDVTRAIRWGIYKHGTKGAHMFEEGFKESETYIKQILNEIPDEIIRRVDK